MKLFVSAAVTEGGMVVGGGGRGQQMSDITRKWMVVSVNC